MVILVNIFYATVYGVFTTESIANDFCLQGVSKEDCYSLYQLPFYFKSGFIIQFLLGSGPEGDDVL